MTDGPGMHDLDTDTAPLTEDDSAQFAPDPAAAELTQELPVVAPDVTLEMPLVEASAEGPEPLYDAPQVQDVPRDPAWPLVGRVLVLPRSTFRRLSAEGLRLWPLALGIVALSALLKTLVAVGIVLTGAKGASLAAVAVRYAAALLGPLLFATVAAGVLKWAERAWRGEASFQLVLSAASLALMPLAVRNIVQAVYIGLAHVPLVHPGLAGLVGHVPHSAVGLVLYGLLAQIDLFTVWAFVLLVLGATVTGGHGGSRRVVTVVLFTVAWLALGLLPSLAMAAVAG